VVETQVRRELTGWRFGGGFRAEFEALTAWVPCYGSVFQICVKVFRAETLLKEHLP